MSARASIPSRLAGGYADRGDYDPRPRPDANGVSPGVLKSIDTLLGSLLGRTAARAAHRRLRERRPAALRGLSNVLGQCGAPTGARDEEAPIFVLSAGWRAGSTLLQRLILSAPDVLLWGEPYDRCDLVPSLFGTLAAFDADWPPAEYYLTARGGAPLSQSWVANLYPALPALRAAHRAFLQSLCAEPARAAGAARWGLKEVRLGIDAARYLLWLYPAARFVFLYRNPYDAWRSYRRRGAPWYLTWPDGPIFTPHAYGRLWRHLVQDFIDHGTALGGLVLRYEDLIGQPASLDALEAHLGLRLDRSVLDAQVGSSHAGRDADRWLPLSDRLLLRHAVEPLAARLGYRL